MDLECFRKWRMDVKLTQDDAGKLLGVSRYTVQSWENGKNKIPNHVNDLTWIYGRNIKKKMNNFPVILAYFDSDFWATPGSLAKLQVEEFSSNSAMLRGVHYLIKTGAPFNHAFVIEKGKPELNIWNHDELVAEIKKPNI